MTVLCLGALAAAVAVALAAPGCRSRRERVVQVMGHNQKAVFDLQSHAGDPIEPDAIRKDLDVIDAGLASLDGDEAFRRRRETARSVLRKLRETAWTPENRRDHFLELTTMCASCHEHYPIAKPMPVTHREAPAESCASCHAEVAKEWRETLHAKAWSDPVYRMSAGGRPDCKSCHIPEPVLITGFDVGYGWRPVTRSTDFDEGVGCAACHLREEGVAAARSSSAPCRPVRDPRIRTAEFCGSCHNPTHDAYYEWKESAAAKRGQSCFDCHMPEVRRGGKTGRSHRCAGGNDPEMVRRAICATSRAEGREVVVTLENLSSHKFPGEVPSRVFHVIFRWEGGEEDLAFRRPNKSEIGWKDNRLRTDEKREIRWKVPDGVRRVEVLFRFQQSPFMLPDGWIDLGRAEHGF